MERVSRFSENQVFFFSSNRLILHAIRGVKKNAFGDERHMA